MSYSKSSYSSAGVCKFVFLANLVWEEDCISLIHSERV